MMFILSHSKNHSKYFGCNAVLKISPIDKTAVEASSLYIEESIKKKKKETKRDFCERLKNLLDPCNY